MVEQENALIEFANKYLVNDADDFMLADCKFKDDTPFRQLLLKHTRERWQKYIDRAVAKIPKKDPTNDDDLFKLIYKYSPLYKTAMMSIIDRVDKEVLGGTLGSEGIALNANKISMLMIDMDYLLQTCEGVSIQQLYEAIDYIKEVNHYSSMSREGTIVHFNTGVYSCNEIIDKEFHHFWMDLTLEKFKHAYAVYNILKEGRTCSD